MVNWRSFISQMLTPGTAACGLFGAFVGVIFAVLCLTIGVAKAFVIGIFCLIGAFIGGVKDKAGFIKKIILFFHREESDSM